MIGTKCQLSGPAALDKANVTIRPYCAGLSAQTELENPSLLKGLLRNRRPPKAKLLLDGQPLDKELKRIAYVETKNQCGPAFLSR